MSSYLLRGALTAADEADAAATLERELAALATATDEQIGFNRSKLLQNDLIVVDIEFDEWPASPRSARSSATAAATSGGDAVSSSGSGALLAGLHLAEYERELDAVDTAVDRFTDEVEADLAEWSDQRAFVDRIAAERVQLQNRNSLTHTAAAASAASATAVSHLVSSTVAVAAESSIAAASSGDEAGFGVEPSSVDPDDAAAAKAAAAAVAAKAAAEALQSNDARMKLLAASDAKRRDRLERLQAERNKIASDQRLWSVGLDRQRQERAASLAAEQSVVAADQLQRDDAADQQQRQLAERVTAELQRLEVMRTSQELRLAAAEQAQRQNQLNRRRRLAQEAEQSAMAAEDARMRALVNAQQQAALRAKQQADIQRRRGETLAMKSEDARSRDGITRVLRETERLRRLDALRAERDSMRVEDTHSLLVARMARLRQLEEADMRRKLDELKQRVLRERELAEQRERAEQRQRFERSCMAAADADSGKRRRYLFLLAERERHRRENLARERAEMTDEFKRSTTVRLMEKIRKRQHAALAIQCWMRQRWALRRRQQLAAARAQLIARRNFAAICIQKVWRGRLCRIRQPYHRQHKLRWAKRKLQLDAERVQRQRAADAGNQLKHSAARRIQAHVRGWLVRSAFRRIRQRAKLKEGELDDDGFDYGGVDPAFYTFNAPAPFKLPLPPHVVAMLEGGTAGSQAAIGLNTASLGASQSTAAPRGPQQNTAGAAKSLQNGRTGLMQLNNNFFSGSNTPPLQSANQTPPFAPLPPMPLPLSTATASASSLPPVQVHSARALASARRMSHEDRVNSADQSSRPVQTNNIPQSSSYGLRSPSLPSSPSQPPQSGDAYAHSQMPTSHTSKVYSIAAEWGMDAQTAKLMLKRQQKLQKAKNKKNLNAEQRLEKARKHMNPAIVMSNSGDFSQPRMQQPAKENRMPHSWMQSDAPATSNNGKSASPAEMRETKESHAYTSYNASDSGDRDLHSSHSRAASPLSSPIGNGGFFPPPSARSISSSSSRSSAGSPSPLVGVGAANMTRAPGMFPNANGRQAAAVVAAAAARPANHFFVQPLAGSAASVKLPPPAAVKSTVNSSVLLSSSASASLLMKYAPPQTTAMQQQQLQQQMPTSFSLYRVAKSPQPAASASALSANKREAASPAHGKQSQLPAWMLNPRD